MTKKRGNVLRWIVVLAAVIGIIYFVMENPGNNTKPHYDMQKTGAGVIVDFNANSQKVHTIVDKSLAAAEIAVKDVQESPREVKRQSVEGLIKWHTRLVDVEADALQVEKVISQGLTSAGAQILDKQQDTYKSKPVQRLDIGFHDMLDGEDITIITDKIYVNSAKTPDIVTKLPGKRATMSIVIDDFGYSAEPIKLFAGMGRPITFAVLPYRQWTNEAATRALASGQRVMIHLPMEPLQASAQSENITITTNLSDNEIRSIVENAIANVPGAVGINNHQGSRATADRRVMRVVLETIKANNLFFVDSRTNSNSIAYSLAGQMGVRTQYNSLFLDNQDNISYVKDKLRTAMQLALNSGHVTVIGHARVNTAKAVREMIPELDAAGVALVFVN